jgi:RNA polymerase sigma-54 factor
MVLRSGDDPADTGIRETVKLLARQRPEGRQGTRRRWMETGYDLSQEIRSWVSPSLIEANHILSLSRQELHVAVMAEIDANPALEQEELPTCSACGNVVEGPWCSVCRMRTDEDAPREHHDDSAEMLVTAASIREDSDEFDPLTLVAQAEDIRSQILRDVRTLLAPEDYPIAEYLIDAIDERGLLNCDLTDLAELCQRPLESIEAIVTLIQEVAPVGVGARSLEESLLLQARFLAAAGEEIPPMTEVVLQSHLAELGAHRFGQIARSLGLTTDAVEAVRDFIRERLNPFPLQSSEARSWRAPSAAQYVSPDVIINLKDDELLAEVVDTSHFHLRINPVYDRLAADTARRRTGADGPSPNGHATVPEAAASAAVSTEDRDHIRAYSSRARLFISNIQQRRDTLLKISKSIVELQEPFLRGGVRELKPLTRAIVAQQVGVHESTVSRATSNKYVMLPNRKVIPFSDFFTPSLSVKDVIKELLVEELRDGEHLTDRRICELLDERGIRIARRTVAKYRAELGILPSTMR